MCHIHSGRERRAKRPTQASRLLGANLLAATLLISLSSGALAAEQPVPAALNLASPVRSVSLAHLHTNTVVILAGQHKITIHPGSILTAAEAAAAQQIISTGKQSLILSNLGTAIAGVLTLPSHESLSSLVVPAGVTVLRDFAASPLIISGNFNNSGNFYAVSSAPNADCIAGSRPSSPEPIMAGFRKQPPAGIRNCPYAASKS